MLKRNTAKGLGEKYLKSFAGKGFSSYLSFFLSFSYNIKKPETLMAP